MSEGVEAFPLGERITYLQQAVPRPDGKSYTWKEIAESTGIGRAYLHALRSGERTEPSLQVAGKLAEHFGVSVDFLATHDHEWARDYACQMDLVTKMGHADVVGIAARAQNLSQSNLQLVRQLVDQLAPSPES
ncbi:helix-turn-helix domain-containing protein [Actinopolyspora halophila]|uniref:helix-turn-helix domain-containing protein n=1 Tax=Actinopolyspora halophila TaxID=1850 RepID=UPI0004755E2E|nr:helix-turn-helix transcriptional regulator [Actinopolyspora halophila]